MDVKGLYLLAAVCMLPVGQLVGAVDCDAFLNDTSITLGNDIYTRSDTIYAVQPGLVVCLVVIPSDYSTDTTCQRLSTDGTITDCGTVPHCTIPFCMITAENTQPADQLMIRVKSNDGCDDWNYTLYVSGFSPLPSFFAVEDNNVTFPWTNLLNFTQAKWLRGDVNQTLLMTYTSDSGDVATETGQQVEYVQGTHSAGMILRNADLNATDQYSVLLNISETVLDRSSTNLTMISLDSYQTFLSQVLLTINNVSSHYGEVIDAVDAGQLVIDVTVPGDYGQSILINCSTESVQSFNYSCGSCTALSCQFTLSEAMPWDRITITIQLDTLQASPFSFLVVVKGLTPQPNVTAVEGCDVILRWDYALEYERVEWYQGNSENGTLLMTYTPSSGNISIEAGSEVKPIEVDDGIGLVIAGVTTGQSGTYTAVVYVTEQARETTSTELYLISAGDFENYAKTISLNVSDLFAINYGDRIPALAAGDVNVTAVVPNDLGVTNTACTVLRADNSTEDCGLCNDTVCQFSVTGADMGDRITINIRVDSVQCSLVELDLIVAGISQIPIIKALSQCAVHFPWVYPASYDSVEWIENKTGGEVIMMSYIPATNNLTVDSAYEVQYINASNSIGMILTNPENNTEYKVRVWVTQFAEEESTTLYQEEDATEYGNFSTQMAGSKPVVEPGSQTFNVSFSNDASYDLNMTCTKISPDETAVSCGNCGEDTCLFNVTGEKADKVEITIDIVDIQCSSFSLAYFFKGIDDLEPVNAIEHCDLSLPWSYPAKFEKAEWFSANGTSEVSLMTYEYSGKITGDDSEVQYINVTDSIGMVVYSASSEQYVVEVMLSSETTEESRVNVTYVPGKEYEEFRANSSIKINNGPDLYYGATINEVDAGDIDLVVSVPDVYDNVTMTCTLITDTGSSSSCGQNNGTNLDTTVTAKELDTISIVVEMTAVQCSSFEFEIKVKVSEAPPKTASACWQASVSNVMLFLAVVWIANPLDV